jgi:transposase-like protein
VQAPLPVTLFNRSAARRPTTQATPMSADQAAEIARLRQENERLRMEQDISLGENIHA